jgi:ATP-binding cassette subfamily F protein uup
MRPLFSGLTFTIEEGDRIGLIGPNGAGKSTLLKILSGQIPHNDGEIHNQQGLRIGLLEQAPKFKEDATIFSSILEGTHDPDDWECMSLVHEYISKLGLTQFGEDTPIASLSGGWKKRVALARELVKNPDLLFLDEPTNHMDIEGITWLEDFLSRARFAVLTITHDRLFLQRVSNRIIELDPRHAGGLLSVQGDYVKYLEIRDQLILAQENRETILKNTLRRETQWLRQGAKARTTKQQARIKAQGDQNGIQKNLSRLKTFPKNMEIEPFLAM